ncbi:hypothetical protein [Shimazuella soli]|uniref:hypothetical protein n=1 Tax=Shimazuella soli TaxID=1892854 RepID=UPI001F105AB9|nr:hypothetical protein [Shimazuella soli]
MFILIGMMIMGMVFYRQAKKVNTEKSYVMPNLGTVNHGEEYQVAMKHMLQHLEESYPKNYPAWIQERVIREHYINMVEFENRWFEWQRFLIMAALLKSVPMYSEEVDAVWHEMLMFTREYEEFSNRYIKTTLHHAPNVPRPPEGKADNVEKSKPAETPGEQRAWFDFIYLLLFEPTPYSITALGPFLRHALSQDVIHDFQTLAPDELEKKYFHTNVVMNFAFMQEIVHTLIEKIQSMFELLATHVDVHGTDVKRFRLNATVQPKNEHPLQNHLVGTLFLAMYHREDFHEQNKRWYKEVRIGA